jgi:hypothetical protein
MCGCTTLSINTDTQIHTQGDYKMKLFWNKFLFLMDSMARAKAATAFVRMGRPDLAKEIMLKD